MANRLNGFLDNIFDGATNPKGTLGDYAHANRLYIADSFRLAPKQKFLYHVVFNINNAIDGVANFTQKHGREINMLVKEAQLPSFNIEADTINQYNRKKNVHTSLSYNPCKITMHDDNFGLTTLLWQAYYRYYFADGNHATADAARKINESNPAYKYDNMYGTSDTHRFRYGLDNGSKEPFFTSIQIFQLSRNQYQAFTLVNPLVTAWSHDIMNQSAGQDIVESDMTVAYETVWYSSGQVEEDNAPKGFASGDHYDKTPSPLSIEGGGTTSLFGQGGVAGGLSGVFASLNDPSTYQDPKKFLGTLLKAANTYKNAKNLTAEGLRNEGLNLLRDGLRDVQTGNFSGISDVVFPKGAGVADSGILGSVSNAVKSANPGQLIETLASNPALQDAVASKVYAAASNASPGVALAAYGALSVAAKNNVKEDVNTKIANGDAKTTAIASQAVGNYNADIT